MNYYYCIGRFYPRDEWYCLKRHHDLGGRYMQTDGKFLENTGIPRAKFCKSYREMVGFLKTHIKGLKLQKGMNAEKTDEAQFVV